VKYRLQQKTQDQGQVQPLEDYYYRFWDLQLEQYQLWSLGFITPEIYSSWMSFRRSEWNSKDMVGGMTCQQAWRAVKERLKNDKFSRFMDKVFQTDETLALTPELLSKLNAAAST
jgi:hypothetical protein